MQLQLTSTHDTSESRFRTCRICGQQKPLDEFPRNRRDALGRAKLCTICNRAHAKAWQQRNRERYLARQRQWADANREYKRAQDRAYSAANREQRAQRERERRARETPEERQARLARERLTKRAWSLRNRDKIAAKSRRLHKGRDKVARAAGQRAWKAANAERVAAADRQRKEERRAQREYIAVLSADPCSYCGGVAEQIDHIVPFSQGGTGDWHNLTAACRSCNVRKNARALLWFLAVR